jgi:DNA-binding MarR family transcriptional regulator
MARFAMAKRNTESNIGLLQRPGFLIRRLHQIHLAIYFQHCEKFNTTPVQSSILQVLNAQPGIDQLTLAAEIGLDRTTVSNVLTRLEERDLVTREVDSRDRRTKRASLTRAGKSILKDMQASIDAAHLELISPLPPADRKRFLRQLLQLVQANNDKGRTLLRNL